MSEPLRIDIGCGKNKKPGFIGVDALKMDGVDVVWDIAQRITVPGHLDPVTGKDLIPSYQGSPFAKWPWEDSSVDEAHCSHVLEHLTNLDDKWERIHFFNELYRVLKPGAGCQLIFPHWASQRFYGDPTHKEVFSEFGFYYLSKEWRKVNAPHADSEFVPWGYNCDLEATWGYTEHPSLAGRSVEYKQQAMQFWLESRQDIVATVKAKK